MQVQGFKTKMLIVQQSSSAYVSAPPAAAACRVCLSICFVDNLSPLLPPQHDTAAAVQGVIEATAATATTVVLFQSCAAGASAVKMCS